MEEPTDKAMIHFSTEYLLCRYCYLACVESIFSERYELSQISQGATRITIYTYEKLVFCGFSIAGLDGSS